MKAFRLPLLPGALLTVFADMPAWAQEFFVANQSGASVTVYSRTASGNTVK